MVVIVKQTWWHIEEIYYPSYARVFRQVMDIFTNEEVISLTRDPSFIGLKVRARNSSNREIPFIDTGKDDENDLLLILTPLQNFPVVTDKIKEQYNDSDTQKNGDLRFVKLEIEYTSIEPGIELLKSKKMSTIAIEGKIQPELYITMPLGWRMSGSKIIDKIFNKKNKEGHLVGMRYFLNNDQNKSSPKNGKNKIRLASLPDETDYEEITFHEPFIAINKGKRTYNYLIDSESYEKIKGLPDGEGITFQFTYISQLSYPIVLISKVPFILFLPIPIIIIGKILAQLVTSFPQVSSLLPGVIYELINAILNSFNLDSQFALPFSILLISFYGVEYSLIREGFNVPHKYAHYIIFVLTILTIFAILFMDCIMLTLCNATKIF